MLVLWFLVSITTIEELETETLYSVREIQNTKEVF